MNGYINRVIKSIETAYRVLSDPESRARYDQLNQTAATSSEHKTTSTSTAALLKDSDRASSKSISLLLVLFLAIAGVGSYWFYDGSSLLKSYFGAARESSVEVVETNVSVEAAANASPVDVIETNPSVETTISVSPIEAITTNVAAVVNNIAVEANDKPQAVDDVVADASDKPQVVDDVPPPVEQVQPLNDSEQLAVNNTGALEQELQAAVLLKQKNAHNPELKQLAINIAETANQNINKIINDNAKFIGAKASNQNITYRFLVIDGVTVSKNLLSAFLSERYMIDSGGVCKYMREPVTAGALLTYAYYNMKGELVGSFYIDEQVCLSPAASRLVKSPDINQLNSIEIEAPSNDS